MRYTTGAVLTLAATISTVAALAVGLTAAAAPAAAAVTYTITDLGSLGGGVTHGLAIDASGQVTGDSVSSQLVQVPCPPRYGVPQKCFKHPDDAFVWSNGTMTDLGTLGGLDSQGVAINGSGEVVGYSAGKDTGTGGEFLWNGRNMKPLSAPAEAYGINDSGQIAGQCRNSMFLQGYACVVSSNGAITALPESNPSIECLYINTIIPANIPAAVAINNNGQVLGNCFDSAGGLAVVWTKDTPPFCPPSAASRAAGPRSAATARWSAPHRPAPAAKTGSCGTTAP